MALRMLVQEDRQRGLFDALAAILHLSNVAMSDAAGATGSLASATAAGSAHAAASGGAGGPRSGSASGARGTSTAAGSGGAGVQCRFADASATTVAAAARLLGVTVDGLQSALTSKEIVVERKPIKTLFSLSQVRRMQASPRSQRPQSH